MADIKHIRHNYYFLIFPIIENITKNAAFTITMLAPGVVFMRSAINIPVKKLITEIIADIITTPLKLLQTLIAVNDGITIRLDIKREPIIIIPRTTVIAVSTAKIMLYIPAFTPVALAKFSSNVTAKILL